MNKERLEESQSIQLVDNFTLQRDQYQWILTRHFVNSKNTPQVHNTYHGSLEQVAKYMLDFHSSRCNTLEELKELYNLQLHKLIEVLEIKV